MKQGLNLIYLHTHDTGRYVQPYDPNAVTPNLMRLAREGCVFRSAFCCGPTCSPSRSGLVTGLYPHQNGMYGLAHRGFSLHDYSRHLGSWLRSHGMETVLCGVHHEAADVSSLGYSHVFQEEAPGMSSLEADTRNTEKAVEFLRGPHEKPFFLSLGLHNTHRPFEGIDPGIEPDYVKVPACLPDTDETRRDFAEFLTCAKRADTCFGRVLDCVRELGLEDNTLVFYTTDHGPAFPHMKCTLRDDGIGVSLILKYPGNPMAGKVCDAMVSHLDLYPTLCEAAGVPLPGPVEGRSLFPLLEGSEEKLHDAIFSEINYHAAPEPARCVRTQRWKYIVEYAPETGTVPANIDGGASKDFLAQFGLLTHGKDREQLYDLMLDPAEGCNLAGNPEYASVLSEMRELLRRHMERTDDFLLHGKLPVVPGSFINNVTCVDPESTDPADYTYF